MCAGRHMKRGGVLGSRPKKMYGERLGDGVEYHLMKAGRHMNDSDSHLYEHLGKFQKSQEFFGGILLQILSRTFHPWMTCAGELEKVKAQIHIQSQTEFNRVRQSPQTEKIRLEIITTAKLSNEFSRESPYISNTFSREFPKFRALF